MAYTIDPAKDPSYLNLEQQAQLIKWLADGDSNLKIVDRIKHERDDGLLYDGQSWPLVEKRQVERWRKTHGQDAQVLRTKVFTTAAETGLGQRQNYARRLIAQIDDLEETIDANNRALRRLRTEGVLDGVAYPASDDGPDVIEADDFTVDGQKRGKSLSTNHTRLVRISGNPNEDPRYLRYLDLQEKNGKLYMALVNYMKVLAQVAGLGNQNKRDEEDKRSAEERREATRTALDRLLATARK